MSTNQAYVEKNTCLSKINIEPTCNCFKQDDEDDDLYHERQNFRKDRNYSLAYNYLVAKDRNNE